AAYVDAAVIRAGAQVRRIDAQAEAIQTPRARESRHAIDAEPTPVGHGRRLIRRKIHREDADLVDGAKELVQLSAYRRSAADVQVVIRRGVTEIDGCVSSLLHAVDVQPLTGRANARGDVIPGVGAPRSGCGANDARAIGVYVERDRTVGIEIDILVEVA